MALCGGQILLGADSLMDSWANVLVDFPVLHPQNAPAAEAIGKAQGPDALDAEIFKVPHHASKHGLNLGLVEAGAPGSRSSRLSEAEGVQLPASGHARGAAGGIERIRPAAEAHKPDWELKIHYTAEEDPDGPLGSMALVRPPKGREVGLWRFRDKPDEPIDLAKARASPASGLIGLAHTAMNLEPPGGLRI